MRLWPRRQVYVDDLPRTHDIRFAALFLVLVVVLFGALYTVGFFVAGDRLARGASVAGVDVGGMRADEARAHLQDELVPRLTEPVKATVLGKSFVLDGERAGISFDIDATLQRGLGSSRWDPTHMLDVVMGGEEIDPVVDIDETRLNRVLARVATAVEVAPIDAKVAFPGGQPTVTDGHDGVQLDVAAAADALREAVLAGDKEVALPVASVPADVGTDEARRFVDGAAARAVSGPVRVKIADVTRTVGIGVFAPALRAESEAGRLVLTVDQGVLAQRSRAIFATLPHHPVNAKIIFRSGRPSVVPSTSGVSVAPADWSKAVLVAVAGPRRRPVRASERHARHTQIHDVRCASAQDRPTARKRDAPGDVRRRPRLRSAQRRRDSTARSSARATTSASCRASAGTTRRQRRWSRAAPTMRRSAPACRTSSAASRTQASSAPSRASTRRLDRASSSPGSTRRRTAFTCAQPSAEAVGRS